MSALERFEVSDPIHGDVPCAALVPSEPIAGVCLFLYGGGGSRESLADIAPLVRSSPFLIATPDVGPWSFCLDDEERGLAWESFVANRFIAALRERYGDVRRTAIVGISMGGYGALKIAFARSAEVAAVAAISPMIEPACEASDVRPRNRFHYPPEVPSALLGADRDAELYRRDSPAARARRCALNDLAIYIDAAGNDALNAHDGAEYLHRVLWDLDVAHEYRLRRDADHIDETMPDRLSEAFAWVEHRIAPKETAPLSDEERALERWLEGDRAMPPPALSPTSRLFPRLLRVMVEPARRAAAAIDETTLRRFGILQP